MVYVPPIRQLLAAVVTVTPRLPEHSFTVKVVKGHALTGQYDNRISEIVIVETTHCPRVYPKLPSWSFGLDWHLIAPCTVNDLHQKTNLLKGPTFGKRKEGTHIELQKTRGTANYPPFPCLEITAVGNAG